MTGGVTLVPAVDRVTSSAIRRLSTVGNATVGATNVDGGPASRRHP